jgi:hypothetical protein
MKANAGKCGKVILNSLVGLSIEVPKEYYRRKMATGFIFKINCTQIEMAKMYQVQKIVFENWYKK